MNIGIIYSNFPPQSGGGYTFQNTILQSLNKISSNHKFFVFYSGSKPPGLVGGLNWISKDNYKKKESNGFKKIVFRRIKKNIHQLDPINEALLDKNIDLVWFMTPGYEQVSMPFIVTVWDLQHRLQPFFPEVSVTGWKWQEREEHYRYFLPRAAYVLTGTEAGKKEIMDFYGIAEDRIKLLKHPTPNFVLEDNKNHFIPKNKLPSNYLFYPAQFWPHKNHIGALNTLKVLNSKYDVNFSLIFTGNDAGNLEFIKKTAKNLRIEKNVIFLGFVSEKEMIFLYKNAYALLYLSFFGPENLPPLEAFALGCPVIAADVPGAREQLGEAALFVDPKNEELIAESILSLKNCRNELIKNGFKKASGWTSDDYVQEMLKIFDEFSKYRRCWISRASYICQ